METNEMTHETEQSNVDTSVQIANPVLAILNSVAGWAIFFTAVNIIVLIFMPGILDSGEIDEYQKTMLESDTVFQIYKYLGVCIGILGITLAYIGKQHLTKNWGYIGGWWFILCAALRLLIDPIISKILIENYNLYGIHSVDFISLWKALFFQSGIQGFISLGWGVFFLFMGKNYVGSLEVDFRKYIRNQEANNQSTKQAKL